MDRSSKLFPSNVIAQCNEAIGILTTNNSSLCNVLNSIESFISDTSIESTAFLSLKNQLQNYHVVINLLRTANEMDIDSYQRLISMVGTDNIEGNVLYELLEKAQKQMAINSELASEYNIFAARGASTSVMQQYAINMQNNYDKLVQYDRNLIEEINKKMDMYDEINFNSKGLFDTSRNLRSIAKNILGEIMNSSICPLGYIGVDNKSICEKVMLSMDMKTALLFSVYNSVQSNDVNDKTSQVTASYVFNRLDYTSYARAVLDGKDGVYIRGNAKAEYSMMYGEIDDSEGLLQYNFNSSAGNLDAEADAKVILIDEEGNINPNVSVKVGGAVNVAEANGKVVVGNDDLDAHITGKGTVGDARANVSANIGIDEESKTPVVEFDVGAEASIVTGEVTTGIGIGDYRIDVTLEGKFGSVGVGANAKVSGDEAEIGGDLGLGLGAGFNIKISKDIQPIDFSLEPF